MSEVDSNLTLKRSERLLNNLEINLVPEKLLDEVKLSDAGVPTATVLKCPVYLRLPYLGKDAYFIERKKLKQTAKNTSGLVKLRIAHFTEKLLNGIYKNSTPDPEKQCVIQF